MKPVLKSVLVGLLMLSFVLSTFTFVQATGQFTSESYNGRVYKMYVPSGYQGGESVPLVVMLHGCTQSADQFAAGTRMNQLAEAENFIVIYPEQPSSANSSKCWNWFETAHQSRGSGEPALVAGMVGQVKSRFLIDEERVFAAGFSSGGAMAVILGATYPDVFAAINVSSGLEYKAATNMIAAFTAMQSGGPNPVTQGNLAYQAMGNHKRVVPVIVFHGTADYTVAPVNGEQVISQWAKTNDLASDNTISDTPAHAVNGQIPGGKSFVQYVYKDSSGTNIMEKYVVNGMGHAWSGGSTAGSYTDPQGPDASQIVYDFFMAHPKNGSRPPNSAPITSANPTGGTYDHPIDVALTPDKPAVTYYTTDGSTPTTNSSQYSGPIPINHTATLKFFSVSTQGDIEAVKSQTYIINSDQEPPAQVVLTSIPAEDGYVGQLFADGFSTDVLKMGDKGMFNLDTYRTILSFDTSAIPANAVIRDAKLRIYRKALTGSVSTLTVDVKNGYFGASSGIEQSDYSATASITNLLSLSIPGENQQFSEASFTGSALEYIRAGNKIQFRIKGSSTASFSPNTLEIYGGDSSQYAPQLIITYE